jgi:acetyl esterase/lipase
MRQRGYYVVAVNYTASLLRGIAGPVRNAADAVTWVAEHASEYGYNADSIGLYGVSAGGHVALMAASTLVEAKAAGTDSADDPPGELAFVFAECAPTDLVAMSEGEAFAGSGVLRLFPKKRLERLSPINSVSPELPPILLFHGDADRTVHINQSRRYADAVRRAGGNAELVEYPGGDHAFLNFSEDVWYRQETRALAFFDRQFASRRPLAH